MSLKKIIIFYPSFEKGGVEIVLVNLIDFFLKKRINVTLISSNFPDKFSKNKFFNYKEFKPLKSIFPARLSRAFSASSLLLDELRKSDSDNTIVFSLQSSSISILISKIFGFKIIVRNAEDPIYSTYYADNKALALITIILKFLTYNFANGIITNSIGSKKSLSKFIFSNKITSIYNPYVKNKFKFKKKKKRKNIILSVGRLTKQKDFQTLIKAFSLVNNKIKNYKLIIIGDGEEKNKLKEQINSLGLQHKVYLKGWLNKFESYYTSSKLFVLSSTYEGLGNVLIDAANYHLPIISTNCRSGPPEIIDHGKGGFLVPVSNKYVLSERIIYVIKNYSLAIKKSNYAKKRVNRFYININSKKYLKYIKKVFYG